MILNYAWNEQGVLRCGWTIPKKVGTAVERNRLKRWCREYVRNEIAPKVERGLDVNIVIRPVRKKVFQNTQSQRVF
jgi:ribonuclease P protein component